MQVFRIEGGRRLSGDTEVQGAKNSVLPIMCASVLCHDEVKLTRCPVISDVYAALRILTSLGCRCRLEKGCAVIDTRTLSSSDIPDMLMRLMRCSMIFMGALVARTGECTLSFPGGCELGPRPIDMHISALRQMGADVREDHGRLRCSARGGLHGGVINLSFPSVGATENIMLAASCAQGETVISNAAREPEISDLAAFMRKCGADISGDGTSRIIVRGRPATDLHGCEHRIMPDRIAAATYLCAAAATGGDVFVRGADPRDLEAVTDLLRKSGCAVYEGREGCAINAPERLRAVKTVRTGPHPGFPTDAQAIVMAALSRAEGTSIFIEDIFENRFRHVDELVRMGADIKTEGRVAVVSGVKRLSGACVEAPDLRGGAALCTAACAAEGETIITGVELIDRGYECMETSLAELGAQIKRV